MATGAFDEFLAQLADLEAASALAEHLAHINPEEADLIVRDFEKARANAEPSIDRSQVLTDQ